MLKGAGAYVENPCQHILTDARAISILAFRTDLDSEPVLAGEGVDGLLLETLLAL
jgi:hypothetical protein